MGFSVMLWGAEKLVPAEYWCPYDTHKVFIDIYVKETHLSSPLHQEHSDEKFFKVAN